MSGNGVRCSTSIGVGIDTARYGHHVVFMMPDYQPATGHLEMAESRSGYDELERTIQRLHARHPQAHFHVRLDAAGNYAVNLEAFVRSLNVPKTVSVGEPRRNQRYREAHYPKRKSDATEAKACARFAVVEQPPATTETPLAFHRLRELVSRLESQTRQTTRAVNQLHNTLARVFPELATLAPKLAAGYVLRLLAKYPTARRLAAARLESLQQIRGMRAGKAEALHRAAARTIGVWQGEFAEGTIVSLVRQVRRSQQAEREWRQLIQQAYSQLPPGGHLQLETIPGIGKLGAAVLTAKIILIDRFERPEQLVSYFGLFPEECTSGVDRKGRKRPPGTMVMSAQGNDLVRKFLWMSAKCACRHNPAVRPLYARLKGRGAKSGTAWGHCMRKLLHLAFAVWKTNQPFDAQHHPWSQARTPKADDLPPSGDAASAWEAPAVVTDEGAAQAPRKTTPRATKSKALNRQVVTAAASNVERPAGAVNPAAEMEMGHRVASPPLRPRVDYAFLRSQITLQRILEHLRLLEGLRGSRQLRGPCPIHGCDQPRSHTFSANLDKDVFQCFHPPCGAKGNVLDFWAAFQRLPLYEAALHLAHTFRLQLTP
jgi:transposase